MGVVERPDKTGLELKLTFTYDELFDALHERSIDQLIKNRLIEEEASILYSIALYLVNRDGPRSKPVHSTTDYGHDQ